MKELAKKVKDYYCSMDDRGDKYIEKALVALSKSENHDAILRAKTKHTKDIDEDKLLGGIENAIAYLTSLKGEGYACIEQRWSGYEDNYFVAVKVEDETDGEYYRRLADAITLHVEQFLKKEDEENAKKKRIQELEKELRQLKGGKK
ncbi:MAG: hypothetical protein IJ550_02260 [Bacteroidaceae bacterium]|nr:hypothetical protein [Bacteroidaceae bacterium]